MAESNMPPPTWFFLDTLRRYVLAPLDLATEVTERERAEIREEQAAFDEFRERLESTPPSSDDQPKELLARPLLAKTKSESMASVRTAYRETVLAVSHYGDVYGEPLIENVAVEFGPELAGALDHEHSLSSVESIRSGFRLAADQAISRRRAMCDTLDEELDSIERARRKLTPLVGELDSITIPDWYREPFEQRLDDIARERQKKIRSYPSPADGDSNLCEYLYTDQPWTYPVLTGIARLRECVDLG